MCFLSQLWSHLSLIKATLRVNKKQIKKWEMKGRNCIKDNGHRHNALWTFSPTFFVEKITQKFNYIFLSVYFSSVCQLLRLLLLYFMEQLDSSWIRLRAEERVAQYVCWLLCLVKWIDCGGDDDEKNNFLYEMTNKFTSLSDRTWCLTFAVLHWHVFIVCLLRLGFFELTVKMKGNDHLFVWV